MGKKGKNKKNALCVKNIGYSFVLKYVTIEWVERIYSTLNFTRWNSQSTVHIWCTRNVNELFFLDLVVTIDQLIISMEITKKEDRGNGRCPLQTHETKTIYVLLKWTVRSSLCRHLSAIERVERIRWISNRFSNQSITRWFTLYFEITSYWFIIINRIYVS